jgi:hypothetical protein
MPEIKEAIFLTSRASTYPGTKRVVAVSIGTSGLLLLNSRPILKITECHIVLNPGKG